MLRSFFVAALLGVVASAQAARTPAEAVQGFYNERIQSHSVGAPTGAELAEFSVYLAPELVCLLSASLRYNDQFAKAHPGEKTPFEDGDLYSSATENPTRFVAQAPEMAGAKGTVRVRFYREDESGTEPRAWEDVVHVAQVRGKWLVADVEYKGEVAAAKRGSLVESLRSVLSNPDAQSGWNAKELNSCSLGAMPAAAKSEAAHTAKGAKAGSRRTSKSASKGVGKTPAKASGKAPSSKRAAPAANSSAKKAVPSKKKAH